MVYAAEIYANAVSADGETLPTEITITARDVDRDTVLEIRLAPGGGQAIRFRPIRAKWCSLPQAGLLLQVFDHRTQQVLYLDRDRGERFILDGLHGSHRINGSHLRSSVSGILKNNVAGEHGPYLALRQ